MVPLLALLLLVTGARTGMADRVEGWRAGSTDVAPGRVGAHDARVDDEGYFERWMVFVRLPRGGFIQASFILTHLGPGSRHAAIDVIRVAPPIGSPPGTAAAFYRCAAKQESAKTSSERLELAFGDSQTLRVDGNTLRLRTDAWGYALELDIDLAKAGAGFRPGEQPLIYPNGGTVDLWLPVTSARVTGRERLGDSGWAPVSGEGYVEWGLSNKLPQTLAQSMIRFQGLSGDVAVAAFELRAPKVFESTSHTWLVVTEGKRTVAWTPDAQSKVASSRKDASKPTRRTPTRYALRGETAAGAISLEVRSTGLLLREDVLAPVPPFIRAFVEAFVQPVNDFDGARFELRLPDGRTLKGHGTSVFSTIYDP
ncbi:MAG: hypothetical protein IV100_00135 [Myxococcales bacterium]|nr:hypothetical protein [Myxococcales bacterium]